MSKALLIGGGQRIQADIIWLLWTMIAFLIFSYLPVFIDSDPVLAAKSQEGFMMLVGSTVIGAMISGLKFDNFYSLEDFSNSLGYVSMSLMAVYVVNVYTGTLQLSSIPISNAMFLMLMGIAEEALFRGFILTSMVKLTGSSLIAVGLSSLIGTAYHSAVYGAATVNMLIVFGSFCVLGFAYVLSGYRLSVPMTAHALINYLSVVG